MNHGVSREMEILAILADGPLTVIDVAPLYGRSIDATKRQLLDMYYSKKLDRVKTAQTCSAAGTFYSIGTGQLIDKYIPPATPTYYARCKVREAELAEERKASRRTVPVPHWPFAPMEVAR